MLDEDAYLGLLLDDTPTERRPLPSGIDPWTISVFDFRRMRRQSWKQELEKHGVTVACRLCGKERKVHPMHAVVVLWCSKSCREKASRQRRKGVDLPVREAAHEPWNWRKK